MANPRSIVNSIKIPLLAWIRQYDPTIEREKRKQIEYEFTNRTFTGDPSKRGAYSEDGDT